MEKSAMLPGRPRFRAILFLAVGAILSGAPARGQELKQQLKFAQLRGYSAGGTHLCGSEKGRSCVVTGTGFSNCNDASTSLRTRDCCPTTAKGGTSSSFVLNYCIPDRL
jgi:hypothetical protein